MAFAGTEHVRLGIRRQNSFKQAGPSGTGPFLASEQTAEGQVWAQAHHQVKPIWKVEKKHAGALPAGLGPSLLGVPQQPAYFFCPRALCRSGSTSVLTGRANSYLQSLPDLFGNTLLYRRTNSRHRPYQQLESFCLRSTPAQKRPFSFPPSSLRVSLTANKVASVSASAMALPLASSAPEPYLSLGAAGENASGKSLAATISGQAPLPLSPPTAFKPVLNKNSFQRPHNTKVPLLPATDALKPLVPPKIQLVSWHHSHYSGGTGDCAIPPLEHKFLEVGPVAPVAGPHKQASLNLNRDPITPAPTKEVELTEAVRKLVVRDFEKSSREGGCWPEQPRLLTPCLPGSALGRSRLRKTSYERPQPQQSKSPQPPQEEADDVTSDTQVFCTKRISIHLLASHTASVSSSTSRLSLRLSCAAGVSPPALPLEEDQTPPVPPSPPQPSEPDVSGVTTDLSSVHLGQSGNEGPAESRELDFPVG